MSTDRKTDELAKMTKAELIGCVRLLKIRAEGAEQGRGEYRRERDEARDLLGEKRDDLSRVLLTLLRCRNELRDRAEAPQALRWVEFWTDFEQQLYVKVAAHNADLWDEVRS